MRKFHVFAWCAAGVPWYPTRGIKLPKDSTAQKLRCWGDEAAERATAEMVALRGAYTAFHAEFQCPWAEKTRRNVFEVPSDWSPQHQSANGGRTLGRALTARTVWQEGAPVLPAPSKKSKAGSGAHGLDLTQLAADAAVMVRLAFLSALHNRDLPLRKALERAVIGFGLPADNLHRLHQQWGRHWSEFQHRVHAIVVAACDPQSDDGQLQTSVAKVTKHLEVGIGFSDLRPLLQLVCCTLDVPEGKFIAGHSC